jgi:Ser/Thr protein kinase RdoA (MazF antagonist)
METLVERIMNGYGLHPQQVLPVQSGYRNYAYPIRLADGTMVNLVLYKRESGMLERIKRANRVGDYLHEHDLPARRTYSSKIARISFPTGIKYGALYEYLPGQTIPWEAYTMKHIKLLGKTMSDMHAVLKDLDSSTLPSVVDEYTEILERMQRYFAQASVARAITEKLKLTVPEESLLDCLRILTLCRQLPDQQALHMDFVRSNILFEDASTGPTISGILDFEKTGRGHRVFDISRTLAFLLVDCKFKSEEKVRKYFLQSGYQKRGVSNFQSLKIKTGEKDIFVLDRLVDMFLLHDYYKFLRHNPYEYLSQNEHYLRTRDLLLRSGMIVTR